jgi:hypothetical protein
MRKTSFALIVIAAFFLAPTAGAEKEPSVHDVYAAVEAGRLDDAHQLIDQVIAAHPKSAKAHYVNAYVLAREGLIDQASTELELAETLKPGLPFASPDAVSKLKNLLSKDSALSPEQAAMPVNGSSNESIKEDGFPWLWVVLGLALVVVVYMLGKRSGKKASPSAPYAQSMVPSIGENHAPDPIPPRRWNGSTDTGYGNSQSVSNGPGLASRIGGGLATGAAVGVGMVAAQHLMSNMLDGNDSSDHNSMSPISDASAAENLDAESAVDSEVSAESADPADFGVDETETWEETSEDTSDESAESDSWEDDSSSDSGGDWE